MKEEKPQWSNELLQFEYCNARGEVSVRHLIAWSEVGHYIKGKGLGDTYPLTYRKDRVVRYIDASECLLAVPHVKPPPRPSATSSKEDRPQILFTGFAAKRKAALEAMATDAGLRVVSTVTQGLNYICGGPNAGPKKLELARAQSCWVLDERQFLAFVETGELPDDQIDHKQADNVPLVFEYLFEDGRRHDVKLVNWNEVGRYVQGSDALDGLWKIFRIDRIHAYLEDSEKMLSQPVQPAPALPPSVPKPVIQLRVIGYKKVPVVKREKPDTDVEKFDIESDLDSTAKNNKKATKTKRSPDHEALDTLAEKHHFKVVQSNTKNLKYVICSPRHSYLMANRLRAAGCFTMTPKQFLQFIETGVLPDAQKTPPTNRYFIERLGDAHHRYFDSWLFDVQPHHWPVFGVSLSDFTEDDEATEEADELPAQVQKYQVWTRVHHWYDFHLGDVFYLRSDNACYLQIADLSDSELLEVHQGVVGVTGARQAYLAQAEQIAFWLRNGHKPEALMQIYQGNSKAGLLAWQLANS